MQAYKSRLTILKAKALIDKQQAWFWSERWQQGEVEAQEDIRKGRTHKFADATSAIDFLHGKASKNLHKAHTGYSKHMLTSGTG
jgi:hypothetical protein